MAKSDFATSAARQTWLEKALVALIPVFTGAVGRTIPDNVRVSIGWPRGSRKAIGQCWSVRASADGAIEIFISPILGNVPKADSRAITVVVLGTLAHEVIHSIAGHEAGHKKPFKVIAAAIGLEGKMTATREGEAFKVHAAAIIEKIGLYPAGKLGYRRGELPPGEPGAPPGGPTIIGGPKKQVSRMLKCVCKDCGYTVRTARKWIDEKGEPHCPEHGAMVNKGMAAPGDGE